MADAITGLVRSLHILTGVAMVGGVFVWSAILIPTVQKRLPASMVDPVLRTLGPRVGMYLDVAGVLALVTGTLLLGRIYGGANIVAILTSGSLYGSLLLGGLVMLVLTYVLVYAFIQPLSKRIDAAMSNVPAGNAPPPIVRSLGARIAAANFAVIALSAGILFVMAAAVNVRT